MNTSRLLSVRLRPTHLAFLLLLLTVLPGCCGGPFQGGAFQGGLFRGGLLDPCGVNCTMGCDPCLDPCIDSCTDVCCRPRPCRPGFFQRWGQRVATRETYCNSDYIVPCGNWCVDECAPVCGPPVCAAPMCAAPSCVAPPQCAVPTCAVPPTCVVPPSCAVQATCVVPPTCTVDVTCAAPTCVAPMNCVPTCDAPVSCIAPTCAVPPGCAVPASCVVPPTGMMPHYEMHYDEYEAVEETEETSSTTQPTGHLWARRQIPAKPVVHQPAQPQYHFPTASSTVQVASAPSSTTHFPQSQVRSVSHEVTKRVPAFTPSSEDAQLLVPEPAPHSSRPTSKSSSSPLKKSFGYKHSVRYNVQG